MGNDCCGNQRKATEKSKSGSGDSKAAPLLNGSTRPTRKLQDADELLVRCYTESLEKLIDLRVDLQDPIQIDLVTEFGSPTQGRKYAPTEAELRAGNIWTEILAEEFADLVAVQREVIKETLQSVVKCKKQEEIRGALQTVQELEVKMQQLMDNKHKKRYGAAFDCYDMNKDGELSTEEAVKMMRDNLTEQIKFTSRHIRASLSEIIQVVLDHFSNLLGVKHDVIELQRKRLRPLLGTLVREAEQLLSELSGKQEEAAKRFVAALEEKNDTGRVSRQLFIDNYAAEMGRLIPVGAFIRKFQKRLQEG